MAHTLYLALGSNLGDRLDNLRRARTALPPQVQVLDVSPVYETEPWGYLAQDKFLNQALRAETKLTPRGVLRHLKAIEAQLGREATFRNGPRVIDLDLLFYDERVIHTPALDVPHPHLHERAFVLVPLAEIAPHLRHPLLGKTIAELLAGIDPGGVTLYE